MLPFGEGFLRYVRMISLAICFAALLPGEGKTSDLWFLSIAFEFLLGMTLGIPVALLVQCSEMWGGLFETGRGSNFSVWYDPFTALQQSSMAILARTFTWANLLLIGTLEWLLRGYAASYRAVPAGQIGSDISQFTTQAAQSLVSQIYQTLSLLLTHFLPFTLSFLLVDLAFAYLAKGVAHSFLHAEAFLVKSAIGFALILFLVHF